MKKALTVYKASAGSGKTFTLTAEYIALLLGDEAAGHRPILAVTFTNKATAEMKMRILTELWSMAYETDKVTQFVAAVMKHLPGVSIEALRRRAAAALHTIIHDYDYFRIQTIDAFFQSLLATLAHDLGLPASFKVEINDKQVVDDAVDRLLATIDTRPELLKWVSTYINRRIDDNKRWDISRELKDLARQIMKEQFVANQEELLKVLESEEALNSLADTLNKMKAREEKHLKEAAKDFHALVESEGGYASFNRGTNVYNFIEKWSEANFEEPSDAQCQYMKDAGRWLKSADKKKGGREDAAEKLRAGFKNFYDKAQKSVAIHNSCTLTLRYLNPLRLIGEIGREVERINDENNRFMLNKTPFLFAELIKKEDAPFVFEKAGTQFRHVMIDEFQDTSRVQWDNFKTLLLENMSQNNSCLLVGDVKQSIYRFRNGDWKILGNIEKEFPHFPIRIENLDTNFRSASNIIAFNNALFPKAAALLDCKDEANSTIATLYDDVAQKENKNKGGCVEVHFLPTSSTRRNKDKDANEEEQPDIPQILAEKILSLYEEGNGVDFKDMAILVRSNGDVTQILNTFAEKNYAIPLISDEAFLLSSSPAIQLLVNALRHLVEEEAKENQPQEEKEGRRSRLPLSKVYVAATYCRQTTGKDFSWTDLLGNEEELLPPVFKEHRKELIRIPLYELCEWLIREFKLHTMPNASPYLFFFLDEVMGYLDGGSSEIHAFLNYWDETLSSKSIPAGEVNGVRILTIHKSKGLAFHTVFMPYCDWDLERDRARDLMWCVPGEEPFNALTLIPISPSKEMANSTFSDIYAAEHLDRRTENLNLMYVAFTRAKQNLFVWARANEKACDEDKSVALSSLSTMGDVLYAALDGREYSIEGEEAKEEKDEEKKKCVNPFLVKPTSEKPEFPANPPRMNFRQSNASKDFLSEEGSEEVSYIDIGKLMHHVFSKIHTLDDVKPALRELEQSGVLASEKDAHRLANLVKKRLEDKVAREWFSPRWTVFNESSIVFQDEEGKPQTIRPDRVITDGEETVVIDFKFGHPDPEHHEQVYNYCQRLPQMGHKHIRGYLWYVYSGKIETVCEINNMSL